jgi:hypothetical protein
VGTTAALYAGHAPCEGIPPLLVGKAGGRTLFGNLALLAFLLTQCGDGILTYVGVGVHGVSIEGNPILAGLMDSLGHGPALLSAKTAAAGLGICLHIRQVHVAVAILALFYLLAAIVPWLFVLFG